MRQLVETPENRPGKGRRGESQTRVEKQPAPDQPEKMEIPLKKGKKSILVSMGLAHGPNIGGNTGRRECRKRQHTIIRIKRTAAHEAVTGGNTAKVGSYVKVAGILKIDRRRKDKTTSSHYTLPLSNRRKEVANAFKLSMG